MIRSLEPGATLYVGVAELATASGKGTLATLGLGSCVALVLYDRHAAVAGLAHVMLPGPEYSRDHTRIGRFPETALEAMLREMHQLGARRPRARLVGGASMFAPLLRQHGVNIGQRNTLAARAALASSGIPLDAEDTGGAYGRSVFLSVHDGAMRIRSVHARERTL